VQVSTAASGAALMAATRRLRRHYSSMNLTNLSAS
jgi:hypothetical protein